MRTKLIVAVQTMKQLGTQAVALMNVPFKDGYMAGPAFDALEAYWKNGTVPPKFIQTESKLYTQADDPQAIYESKKNLGY